MKRADLIALLGGAFAVRPRSALARAPGGLRKISVLDPNAASEQDQGDRLLAFKQGLHELGWIEGQNVQFAVRYAAGKYDRLPGLAAELLNPTPDLVLAVTNGAASALKELTRSVPILFVLVGEPVKEGFADSLAHPGGNMTGFARYDFAIGTKWLQLLKDIAPSVKRVVVVFNPKNLDVRNFLGPIAMAARSARVDIVQAPVQSSQDIAALAPLLDKPATGLISLPDAFLGLHRGEITRLAARYRVAAVYGRQTFDAFGGLMSYDIDETAIFRQAASYANRILRGEKPGDLPIQNPTRYHLTIDLKTAAALGLSVPQSLLVSADEVIK